MKLNKRGYYKDKGDTLLASSDLSSSKRPPAWDDESGHLVVNIKGEEGSTTYGYRMQFTGEELALLVETALIGACGDLTIHAHAKAMGAFIREVLRKVKED